MENSQSSGVNALHITEALILPEFGTEDFRLPVGEKSWGRSWLGSPSSVLGGNGKEVGEGQVTC